MGWAKVVMSAVKQLMKERACLQALSKFWRAKDLSGLGEGRAGQGEGEKGGEEEFEFHEDERGGIAASWTNECTVRTADDAKTGVEGKT